MHPPCAHLQHLKVLKYFAYICHGWGMLSLGVWSLNHDLTTTLGLSHAPIFQKSTASQGAKTLFISNMDVGCSRWGFLASTMILQHQTGSAIPQFSKIHPHLNNVFWHKGVPMPMKCPSTASQGAKTLCIHPIWMWDAVNGGLQPQT